MSDQIVSFDCPSCGGPLDHVHAVNNLVRCPFCAKNVIVPESLRAKPEPPPQPPSQTVIHVIGSIGGYSETQAAAAQARTIKAPRWVSCLVIFLVVFTAAITIVSVAAPLLATSLIFNQLKGIIPGILPEIVDGEVVFSQEDSRLPDISPTIDAVMTQVAVPLQPTEAPAFYTVLAEFGEDGIGPGMFDDSRWVAVDPSGSLYTAEYQDGRVQRFDSDGKFQSLIQVKSKVALLDLAVSRQGVLYVVIQGEILKFDSQSGTALGQVEYAPDHYFNSLALTADGGLVAISDSEDLVRFDASEQVTLAIPDAISSITGDPVSTVRVFADGLGTLYLLGSKEGSVFVYSREGKYLNRLFSLGNEANQLRSAHDLVVDGKGRFIISDIKGVMIFSADGQYQGLIDVQGAPFGLALDDQNHLLVMSNAPRFYRIQINE